MRLKGGCKCSKSACQKKYCECFRAGATCGDHCVCQNCQNCGENHTTSRAEFGQQLNFDNSQPNSRKVFRELENEQRKVQLDSDGDLDQQIENFDFNLMVFFGKDST